MGKLTALKCAHCGWSTGKFDWRSGKAVPSFIALYRHVMSEHSEELGITRGEWDTAIADADRILKGSNPVRENGVDYTQSIEGSLDKHNAVQRSIAETRDALPRMTDAMEDFRLIAWTSGNAWTGVSYWLELGDDGRYFVDPDMLNQDDVWPVHLDDAR